MSGGGWWSDETGVKGVWMNPSPPPQMTVSALRKHKTFVVRQITHTDATPARVAIHPLLKHLKIIMQKKLDHIQITPGPEAVIILMTFSLVKQSSHIQCWHCTEFVLAQRKSLILYKNSGAATQISSSIFIGQGKCPI